MVELESVVEVYPTDDIQFVCVIDDTLDKVWWEKDGKEVSLTLAQSELTFDKTLYHFGY